MCPVHNPVEENAYIVSDTERQNSLDSTFVNGSSDTERQNSLDSTFVNGLSVWTKD